MQQTEKLRVEGMLKGFNEEKLRMAREIDQLRERNQELESRYRELQERQS